MALKPLARLASPASMSHTSDTWSNTRGPTFTATMEPPNKGHYGANDFVTCREVVPTSTLIYSGTSEQGTLWGQRFCPFVESTVHSKNLSLSVVYM